MTHVSHVPIAPLAPMRFRDVLTDEQFQGLLDTIERARDVIASRVEEFGRATAALFNDPAHAAELGTQARTRVRESFLGPRHLAQYVDLFDQVLRGHEERTQAT